MSENELIQEIMQPVEKVAIKPKIEITNKIQALLEYAKSKRIDITAEDLNACKSERAQIALIVYKLGVYLTIRITFTIWMLKALVVIPFSQLLVLWLAAFGINI